MDNTVITPKIYSHNDKKKLAAQINLITNKNDLIEIYKIISTDNAEVTNNQNGCFAIFNKLKNDTYVKIEQFINNLEDRQQQLSPTSSDKKEYIPYHNSEFPAQESLNPKLKYSNKEKNLIKRQRYDNIINSDQDAEHINFNTTSSVSPESPINTTKKQSPKKLKNKTK